MVSVVRCWKAEYQKCKHSILLYMHSMIPIICAAIFAGYYLSLIHISLIRASSRPSNVVLTLRFSYAVRFS